MKFKDIVYPFIPIAYYRLTAADEREEIDYDEKELYKGYEWLDK